MRPHVVAENPHGRICIPASSAYTYTARAILAGQVHELSTIDFIAAHAGTGDVVHAGAGFGDFLPALSRACAGTIWTFEPNPENFACAAETLRLNGLQNVRLSDTGLAARPGRRRLRVQEDGLALGPRSEFADETAPEGDVHRCVADTLDRLLDGRPVSVIHLDVEGAEFEVLDGARGLIARCSPWIVLEIDGRALDYNRYMDRLGYRPHTQLVYDCGEMVFVNTAYARRA